MGVERSGVTAYQNAITLNAIPSKKQPKKKQQNMTQSKIHHLIKLGMVQENNDHLYVILLSDLIVALQCFF